MTTQSQEQSALEVTVSEPTGGWYHGFSMASTTKYWGAVARILLGFTFLWAFLDKNFGWQFSTAKGQGWMFGAGDGDPTFGFLKFGTNPNGPFASVFTGLRPGAAPDPTYWTNYLFMAGLLGIGVALMSGVFMRIGAISGAVMLMLMYLAEAPWAKVIDPTGASQSNNPLIDDHVIYSVVLIMLMLFGAARVWGLGKIWESQSIVKSQPWLA